ncbi:hypothetical protein J3R30DRAFT_2380836 [Lentinula aciculospora]|uniref:Uncharacterized protein n=1 Tax=Lentinula aciculospora TaxID=153920 RepID=A0A9W9AEV5_9AGAR|nr:hypothetical protein J3R30DRAFT_2380836 [Lentinula aciculospora]
MIIILEDTTLNPLLGVTITIATRVIIRTTVYIHMVFKKTMGMAMRLGMNAEGFWDTIDCIHGADRIAGIMNHSRHLKIETGKDGCRRIRPRILNQGWTMLHSFRTTNYLLNTNTAIIVTIPEEPRLLALHALLKHRAPHDTHHPSVMLLWPYQQQTMEPWNAFMREAAGIGLLIIRAILIRPATSVILCTRSQEGNSPLIDPSAHCQP